LLFTDSDIITPGDLAVVDQEVITDATALNVTLSGPGSIIRRAVEEAGTEITAAFQNFSGYLVGLGISANHVAAVLNTLTTAINRPRARLNQVCALDPDPTHLHMKRWLEYRALTGFYRSLYHRKVEDRFEKKMNNYRAEANFAWSNLTSNGLPIVLQPLACPGALRELGSGTWGPSNVSASGTGSSEIGHVYDVAITWVNSQGYVSWANNGNGESAPSAIVTLSAITRSVLTLALAGLNPPNGTIPQNLGTADGIYTPQPATGWNVYVGITGQTLWLQNATPIPIATTGYTLADAPTLTGNPMGQGQHPDYHFAFQQVLWRA
jgi:hypothetical protein